MELCLHGSQINLATRDTNTTKSHFFSNQISDISIPSKYYRRPNSAQVQPINTYHSPKNRPQSADSRYKNFNVNKLKSHSVVDKSTKSNWMTENGTTPNSGSTLKTTCNEEPADSCKLNFSAWVDEHQNDKTDESSKVADLPGRVSFSNSCDVLCVGDLSDESNGDEVHQSSQRPSSRKTVHFQSNPVFVDTSSKCDCETTPPEKKCPSEKYTSFEIPITIESESTTTVPQKDAAWNNNKISGKQSKKKNGEIIKNNFTKKISKKIENNNSKKTLKSTSTTNVSAPQSQRQTKPQNYTEKVLIKKSRSISCLGDGSNMNEFQIDKIESWMSMYECDDIDKMEGDRLKHKLDSNLSPSSPSSISSSSMVESTTTYDEIVDIIKEIDGGNKDGLTSSRCENQVGGDQSVEQKLWAILNATDSDDSGNTSGHIEMDSKRDSDKMKEIIKYLDDVDEKCNKTLDDTRKSIPLDLQEIQFCIETDIIEDVPKVSDLVMFPNHQLARRIVTLSLRANELSHGILLAKEHLSHVRDENQKAIRSEKQNSQQRLTVQKNHYEKIIHRHQGFIEQLLRDKSILSEKISHQSRRMESQNQAWEHKQSTEIQRVRETLLAGEKIRREKWVRDNTKRIKELTVKGIESEINKMAANHQAELSDLKRFHQQELEEVEEKVRRKYDEIEKTLRESYEKERECIIERERIALRDRTDRQMESEQNALEQKRQRLVNEHAELKERVYLELKEKEEMFESIKEELIKEKNDLAEHMKRDFHEKFRAMEMKQQTEILSLQQQFESDFAIWKREHETIYKRRQIEAEDVIRQQCRLERDRQIDAIVAKVDAEHSKAQQDYELRIMRLTEKYENDMKELEKNENLFRVRFNVTRLKLSECEAAVQNHEATIKRLELELSHTKTMRDELTREKEGFKELARKDFQAELETFQKERSMEIEQIYGRLQQAIEKKDKTLEYLQKENLTMKEKCFKLEALIRQQRKDYCIK